MRWLVLVFMLVTAPVAAEEALGADAIHARALALYSEALETEDRDERLARFHQAKLQLDRLVATGIENADLHADIGNAALQAEELGPAILAYRRALLLDPDHDRATRNLEHARSLLPAWVPVPRTGGALDTFFFWHRTLSHPERALLAALCFAMAMVLLATGVYFQKPILRNLTLLPLLAWLALLASLWFAEDASSLGVIITPGGEPALSADAPSARPVFSNPLPEGTEATILERRDEWTRIRLADDSRTAWVRSGSLATVGAAK